MLDMIHYLNDEDLMLTLSRVREQLNKDGRLLIRVTIPTKETVPWFRWIETTRLKINQMESYYRPADEIQKIILQSGYNLHMMKPSGPDREETWFLASVVSK